jgi:hypothetical protein
MNSRLPRTEDNTFANALMQVCRQTKLIKRNRPGLPTALGLNLLFTGGYRLANSIFSKLLSACCFSGRANPILTNFVGLEKAYLVGPNFMAPGLLMSASSFRNQLTLSVGYNQSIISDTLVSIIFNETVAQLESAVSYRQNSNNK